MGLRSSRWLLAVVPFAVACGGDAEPTVLEHEFFPEDAGEQGTNDAGALDGAIRRDSGTRPGNTYDGGVEDPGTFDPDAACAASAVAAQQVVVTEEISEQVEVKVEVKVPAPVALYVQFDRSASMGDGVPFFSAGSHQWEPAVAALKSFVNDTKSSGMDIALGYFPGNGTCSNGSGYDTPAVAMGRLPGNATKIAQSLDSNGPDGTGTPIEGALRGAIAFCKKFQTQNPTEKCVAVLVTDGKPEWATGCSESETDLANIAKAAWEGTNPVRTFTVGLAGADFGLLDKIAQAGGAADCDPTNDARFSCDVSSGADKLNVALGKVRDTVTELKTEVQTVTKTVTKTEQRPLACTWNMPQPAAGVAVDKNKVNVTVGGNGVNLPLGKVPAPSSCKIGGWYFNDPSNPTQIIACPETCTAITTAKATDVQIQLGCETEVLVI